MSCSNLMLRLSYCFGGWWMRYVLCGRTQSHDAEKCQYDERQAECLLLGLLHGSLLPVKMIFGLASHLGNLSFQRRFDDVTLRGGPHKVKRIACHQGERRLRLGSQYADV